MVSRNVELAKTKKSLACLPSGTDPTISRRYAYNFEWLGRPIIQYPQDIVCLQELIWRVKPSVIVETENRAWRFIDPQRFRARAALIFLWR